MSSSVDQPTPAGPSFPRRLPDPQRFARAQAALPRLSPGALGHPFPGHVPHSPDLAAAMAGGGRVLSSVAGAGRALLSGLGRAEHAVTGFASAQFSRLPGAIRSPLAGGTKLAFSTYIAGQHLTEQVALETGKSPEQAAYVRKLATAGDLVGAKAVPSALAALGMPHLALPASFVPAGSTAYLARHPLATAKVLGRGARSALRTLSNPLGAVGMAGGGEVPGVPRLRTGGHLAGARGYAGGGFAEVNVPGGRPVGMFYLQAGQGGPSRANVALPKEALKEGSVGFSAFKTGLGSQQKTRLRELASAAPSRFKARLAGLTGDARKAVEKEEREFYERAGAINKAGAPASAAFLPPGQTAVNTYDVGQARQAYTGMILSGFLSRQEERRGGTEGFEGVTVPVDTYPVAGKFRAQVESRFEKELPSSLKAITSKVFPTSSKLGVPESEMGQIIRTTFGQDFKGRLFEGMLHVLRGKAPRSATQNFDLYPPDVAPPISDLFGSPQGLFADVKIANNESNLKSTAVKALREFGLRKGGASAYAGVTRARLEDYGSTLRQAVFARADSGDQADSFTKRTNRFTARSMVARAAGGPVPGFEGARFRRRLAEGGDAAPMPGVDFRPRGTDTVPAQLRPGSFVVNARSAEANAGLLDRLPGSVVPERAAGGGFTPGAATRASARGESPVPAMLTPRERVIAPEAAQRFKPQLERINAAKGPVEPQTLAQGGEIASERGREFARFEAPRLAKGGGVAAKPPPLGLGRARGGEAMPATAQVLADGGVLREQGPQLRRAAVAGGPLPSQGLPRLPAAPAPMLPAGGLRQDPSVLGANALELRELKEAINSLKDSVDELKKQMTQQGRGRAAEFRGGSLKLDKIGGDLG